MLSDIVYAAMKLNPQAAELVAHSQGFTQAVVVPNQEVLFLRPALEPGFLYTFSRKLSEIGGFEKLDDGSVVYNNPVEFRVPISDDLVEISMDLRNRWLSTYAQLTEESAA